MKGGIFNPPVPRWKDINKTELKKLGFKLRCRSQKDFLDTFSWYDHPEIISEEFKASHQKWWEENQNSLDWGTSKGGKVKVKIEISKKEFPWNSQIEIRIPPYHEEKDKEIEK